MTKTFDGTSIPGSVRGKRSPCRTERNRSGFDFGPVQTAGFGIRRTAALVGFLEATMWLGHVNFNSELRGS